MINMVRDLSHGWRALMKNPVGAVLMILALALGIGLNVSCFIMVSAIVLHPLPFPGLDRIMMVQESVPKLAAERDAAAPANFRDWKEQNHSFERLAAFQPMNGSLTAGSEPQPVDVTAVSADFFPLLGIAPEQGRTFRADEMEAARARVAVVSHGFQERHFASAADVVGRTLSLEGRSYTVIGVMPSSFSFPLENEIWIPLALTHAQASHRDERSLQVLARLRPGVSVAGAREDLHTIATRLARQYPDSNEGRDVVVTPLRELINNVTDRFTLVLMATAGFVLLLACVNIANLQLARAVQRQKEIAIRTALGAGRYRILRQLLTESLLIAIPGGALGLCLGAWDLALTQNTIPAQVYHWVAGLQSMRVNATVVLFTFALALAAGVLCMLPAGLHLISRRVALDTNESLKEGGRGSSTGVAGGRMRNAFAVAEVSLALVLLIGAGLMVKTFQRMLQVNAGFDPKNVLVMNTSLSTARYGSDAQVRGFAERALAGVGGLPGVQSVAIDSVPSQADAVLQQGRPEPRPGEPRPVVHAVTPQYFAALRVPVLSGRAISAADQDSAPGVVVLSNSVARYYWPQGDAIGRHIRLHRNDRTWLTVVGTVGDVKDWFSGKPMPRAYVPFAQQPGRSVRLLLRTGGDPLLSGPAARQRLLAVDAAQPIAAIKSMDQMMSEQTSGVRASAMMMSIYAGIALLLAISGVYAVVSYSVAQRTHEIGVRIALGAGRGAVVRMTLQQAMRIAAIGLCIGIPAAFALMRLMSSVLYNAVALDAVTFVAFAAALALCSLVAGWVPARRAASTDPIAALRHE